MSKKVIKVPATEDAGAVMKRLKSYQRRVKYMHSMDQKLFDCISLICRELYSEGGLITADDVSEMFEKAYRHPPVIIPTSILKEELNFFSDEEIFPKGENQLIKITHKDEDYYFYVSEVKEALNYLIEYGDLIRLSRRSDLPSVQILGHNLLVFYCDEVNAIIDYGWFDSIPPYTDIPDNVREVADHIDKDAYGCRTCRLPEEHHNYTFGMEVNNE